MDDLISRQAAIRIAEQGQIQGYPWQFEQLVKLPSAQPEIIRCKDCIKCGFCGDETNLEIMGFNGFCSRAERRDNDE